MINESQTDKAKVATAVSVGSVDDGVDAIAERIRSGEAILEVVAYPWGVEFELCESPELLDITSAAKRKAPRAHT